MACRNVTSGFVVKVGNFLLIFNIFVYIPRALSVYFAVLEAIYRRQCFEAARNARSTFAVRSWTSDGRRLNTQKNNGQKNVYRKMRWTTFVDGSCQLQAFPNVNALVLFFSVAVMS